MTESYGIYMGYMLWVPFALVLLLSGPQLVQTGQGSQQMPGASIKERLWRIKGLDIGGPTDRSILMWRFYLDQVGSDRAGRSRGARQPQRNVFGDQNL